MPPFSVHGRLALAALLPIILVALFIGVRDNLEDMPGTVDVGVQLTEPAALSLTVGSRRTIRLIEMSHTAQTNVAISVPEAWVRTEVRGVPLESVIADEPSLGYVRWTVPPGARVSFRSEIPFSAVRIHNPAAIPLSARLTAVDLDRDTTHIDARILSASVLTLPLTDTDFQRLP